MHSCPECGQACYCHGDIDDCELEPETMDCDHCPLGGEDYDNEEDW